VYSPLLPKTISGLAEFGSMDLSCSFFCLVLWVVVWLAALKMKGTMPETMAIPAFSEMIVGGYAVARATMEDITTTVHMVIGDGMTCVVCSG